MVEIEADLTLVERLRAGDTGALETLMERYASRVYRLAYGITRNEADAEEAVQDVFLTIFRRTGRRRRRRTCCRGRPGRSCTGRSTPYPPNTGPSWSWRVARADKSIQTKLLDMSK